MRLPQLPRSAALAACMPLLLCPLRPLHAQAADDSTVVAHAGDATVTAAELRTTVKGLDASIQAAVLRDPAAVDKVINSILAERLLLKEAFDKKWDQDPSVAAALSRLRNNAIVQTYLQSVSKPPDSYPSADEVQAAYDANKSQLLVQRQYDLAQIYIKNPKGSDATAQAKAKVKLAAVTKALAKRSADFGAIATAESDDAASSAKAGEIGWLTESRIQPEIRSQLGSLSKGSVSPVFKLDDGWHFVKVLDVKEPYTPPLDQIHDPLVQKMRSTRQQQDSQQYLSKIIQATPPQIDEAAVSAALKQP